MKPTLEDFITFTQNTSVDYWCMCICVQCSLCLLLSGQLHVVMVHLNPLLLPQLYCFPLLLLCFSRQLQQLKVPSSILNFLSIMMSLKMARNKSLNAKPRWSWHVEYWMSKMCCYEKVVHKPGAMPCLSQQDNQRGFKVIHTIRTQKKTKTKTLIVDFLLFVLKCSLMYFIISHLKPQ